MGVWSTQLLLTTARYWCGEEAMSESCGGGVSLLVRTPHLSTCTSLTLQDSRLPKPPAYIFLIDVSAASVTGGLLSLLSQSILTVLESLPE